MSSVTKDQDAEVEYVTQNDVFYAHSIDIEGHVNPLFDSDWIAYQGVKGLLKLRDWTKEIHAEYPYMTHEIADWGTHTVQYRWKRRVHPEEAYYFSLPYEEGPYKDSDLFVDWIREQSEIGGEPGTFDPDDYAPY